MICTVIALTAGNVDFSALPAHVREHILSAKNEKLRSERATAYLLLYKLCDRFFGEAPSIIFTEGEKPRFSDGKIYFNISHTAFAVAVTLSDRADVGVDIEGEVKEARTAGIEARFLGEMKSFPAPLSVKYLFAEFSDKGDLRLADLGEENIVAEKLTESEDLPFTAKWTLAEAAVKLTGEGVAGVKKADEILPKANADIIKIKIKLKTYYLTTAEEK